MPIFKHLSTSRALVMTFALSSLAISLSACVDLDSKGEVKDLRILGVALDPPEIVYSAFMAFPAAQRPPMPTPPTIIQARVLAADPHNLDTPVLFSTKICPENNGSTCRNYEIPADIGDTERDAQDLRDVLADMITPQQQSIDPGDMGLLDANLASFTIAERAIEYMLPHSPDGAASVFFQDYARVITYAESQNTREVAYRLLPMNVNFDLSFLPPDVGAQIRDQFSNALGIDICTPEQALEEAPDCLKPRQANQNPIIEAVRYSLDAEHPQYDADGEDTREIGHVVDGPVVMQAGQEINIWPVLNRGHLEPYQIFEINLQESTLQLSNYREDMAVSWYASRGGVSPSLTPLPITQDGDLSASYSYPEKDIPEQVTIYMVVRDQRGGMTWATLMLKLDGV